MNSFSHVEGLCELSPFYVSPDTKASNVLLGPNFEGEDSEAKIVYIVNSAFNENDGANWEGQFVKINW